MNIIGHIAYSRKFSHLSERDDFYIILVPEDNDPAGLPLFGFGGKIVSKRGLAIMTGAYKILVRNLTTYRRGDGQKSQNIVLSSTDGWYTAALADLASNKAVKVGDRIAVIAANSSLTRCYGFKVHTINEDDIENGNVILNILVP